MKYDVPAVWVAVLHLKREVLCAVGSIYVYTYLPVESWHLLFLYFFLGIVGNNDFGLRHVCTYMFHLFEDLIIVIMFYVRLLFCILENFPNP